MKTIQKTILGIILFSAFTSNAQDTSYQNMVKIGLNGGASLPMENAAASVGVDLGFQHLVTPGFGVGIMTGYNQYFGRENDGIENNDFGVIPVAALLRFYPKQQGFYIGADVGYGFITGKEDVASNSSVDRPDGGFYFKPEIGYHNIDWNFAIQYNKVFTGEEGKILSQDYNAGSLGIGISYNLPLGKNATN